MSYNSDETVIQTQSVEEASESESVNSEPLYIAAGDEQEHLRGLRKLPFLLPLVVSRLSSLHLHLLVNKWTNIEKTKRSLMSSIDYISLGTFLLFFFFFFEFSKLIIFVISLEVSSISFVYINLLVFHFL